MIRFLRPSDLARLLLLRPAGGETRAFTLDSAAHPSSREYRPHWYFARSLMLKGRRDGWIAFGESGVSGIMRIRRRNGPSVWEISELFMAPGSRPEIDGAEMLGDLSEVAATAGVQRVFLRIEDGSPMATAARHAGYKLQTRETLYRRPQDLRGQDQVAHYPGEYGWRTVRKDDLQQVFRLYGISTPLSVRETAGMTLSEWRDALEPLSHSIRNPITSGRQARSSTSGEMLLENKNGPVAWIRYSDESSERLFTLVVEPEADIDLDEVVNGVLAGGYGMQATMLVPLYARRIAMALQDAEFVPGSDYELFTRQTAEKAKIPRNVMVAAGG